MQTCNITRFILQVMSVYQVMDGKEQTGVHLYSLSQVYHLPSQSKREIPLTIQIYSVFGSGESKFRY